MHDEDQMFVVQITSVPLQESMLVEQEWLR